MGVPGLGVYIKEKCPRATISHKRGVLYGQCDALAIDGNGLIHTAAQIVYGYGEYERVLPIEYDDMNEGEKRVAVFEVFFGFIEELVEMFPPRQLFLGIDGVAPRAKQAQQRSRRCSSSGEGFNTSNITAGTLYMHELHKFMKARIRKLCEEKWKQIEVTYSPHTVPGEGEHKLLEWLRKLSGMRVTIYSPDGDLIMLALAIQHTKQHDVTLVRNTFRDNTRVDVITISEVKVGVPWRDFIFSGFFVGNDFLPRIVAFDSLKCGMYTMIEALSEIKLCNEEGPILKNFLSFVEILAKQEESLLMEQFEKIPRRSSDEEDEDEVDPQEKFRFHTLYRCVFNRKLDMKKFRKEYYAKMYIEKESDIQKVCHNYVQVLVWVYEYYVSGLPSWNICYEYWYAPLLSDLVDYLRQSPKFSIFDNSQPSLPFVQLLCVLSKKSALEFIPKEYTSVAIPQMEHKRYYNMELHDYEGKKFEHEKIVRLSFVDRSSVEKMIKDVVPERTYLRNTVGCDRVFFYDESTDYEYRTKFYSTPHCHVTSIPLAVNFLHNKDRSEEEQAQQL